MHYSVIVLTTALLTAAPGDAPPDNKTAAPVTAAQAMTAPAPTEVSPPPKPTFGQRLRNFFSPQHPERPEHPEVPMLEPREVQTTVAPAKTSVMVPSAKVTVAAPSTTVTAMRPNFDLTDKDLKQVGHETDYSWITGKLSRAPGASGRWVLRYTAPYEEDKYGGSVTLGSSHELATYHEGDLICVHGKVHGGGSAGRTAASATYDVQSINLIERAGH